MADKTCMCGVNFEGGADSGFGCVDGIDAEIQVKLEEGGDSAILTFVGGILKSCEILE